MAFDILKDDEGDLAFDSINGDLSVGFSDFQHFDDLTWASPGDFKANPLIGANAFIYQNSTGKARDLETAIRLSLQADGVSSIQVEVVQELDKLTASYYGIYL